MFGTCCLWSFLLCSSLSCWWICGTRTWLCNVKISSLPRGNSKDLSNVPFFFWKIGVGVGRKAVWTENIVHLLCSVTVGMVISDGLLVSPESFLFPPWPVPSVPLPIPKIFFLWWSYWGRWKKGKLGSERCADSCAMLKALTCKESLGDGRLKCGQEAVLRQKTFCNFFLLLLPSFSFLTIVTFWWCFYSQDIVSSGDGSPATLTPCACTNPDRFLVLSWNCVILKLWPG